MGEIGKDFLPEDIFAEVDVDTSRSVVRKNDQTADEMSQYDEANINQKKGKNFDKKHISKTSKKLFLLVLFFVFIFVLLFILVNFVINMISNNSNKINNIDNKIVVVEDVSDGNSQNSILKDTDGDGLIDIEESNFDTDYNSFDTDNDLVSDGDEVKKYRTSPLSPDTDGDGVSDYDEIFIYKTNPLSSDTDADGYRDMDEINNSYSPIGPDKMTEEYLKEVDYQKTLKGNK